MGRNPPREPLTPEEWRARHLRGSPPRILADPELRTFIDARLPAMTFDQLAAVVRTAFGPARAPSRSAIHRYWKTVALLRPEATEPPGAPADRS